jgi:hypothetical protein
MSKVIITNTLGTPIFIGGTLLSNGMSMEVEAHDVPDCLSANPSDKPIDPLAPPPPAESSEPPAPTDEDLLVAAAKAKGK